LRDKPKGEPIVAPALARGLGAVVEDVPLMAATPNAVILRSGQNQLEVRLRSDMAWDGLCEARPTGPAVEFGIRSEKGEPTSGAEECTHTLLIVERMGKGTLRTLLEEDRELIRGQELAPLGFRFVELGRWLRS
jgi:hypothetical protein